MAVSRLSNVFLRNSRGFNGGFYVLAVCFFYRIYLSKGGSILFFSGNLRLAIFIFSRNSRRFNAGFYVVKLLSELSDLSETNRPVDSLKLLKPLKSVIFTSFADNFGFLFFVRISCGELLKNNLFKLIFLNLLFLTVSDLSDKIKQQPPGVAVYSCFCVEK